MWAKWINRLWLRTQKKEYLFYKKNISSISKIQENILLDIIEKNKNSSYGKKYHFDQINSIETFRKNVPIIYSFDQIQSEIHAIAKGKENILFSENILFFEETSGSTSRSKLIPYTQSLKQEFQRSVAVWLYDLYLENPQVFNGKAYWSLSPALKEKYMTEGKIAVGMTDDTEYLSPWMAFLFKKTLAVNDVSSHIDRALFYASCWEQLMINKASLRFISVWSPNFLLQLLKEYERIYGEKISSLKSLFPQLELISCWTDAQAAIWMDAMHKVADGVHIQSKGLLSTEGVITIPFQGKKALAYTSHFYEFMDNNGNIVSIDNLNVGEIYEVIITTGGGLYRYHTKDRVKCYDFIEELPCFHFVGRGRTSDMVGEKINEQHIQEIATKLREELHLAYVFCSPIHKNNESYYIFDLFSATQINVNRIRKTINKLMLQNSYYAQAISAGQLQPAKIIYHDIKKLDSLILTYGQVKNIKEGDIKLPILFEMNERYVEDH